MPNLYFSSLQIPLRSIPFTCSLLIEWHPLQRQSVGLLEFLYQSSLESKRDVGPVPALSNHFLPSPPPYSFVKTGFPFVSWG